MGNVNEPLAGELPKGITRMPLSLQKRLQAPSCTYNLKVLIRGDRGVGKTALLRRLEGKSFLTSHEPTAEIQTTHIQWSYKGTSDVVKLEVWDVVDEGVDTSEPDTLQGGNLNSLHMNCDASNVDVYNGAHAVICIVDPRRRSTFEYSQQLIKDVPSHLDVLLLVGFRDQRANWIVRESEISEYVRGQPARIKSLECSLLNCYGLRELYDFINIPFLKIKVKYLEEQTKVTKQELLFAMEEYDVCHENQNYTRFQQYISKLADEYGCSPSVAAQSHALHIRQTSSRQSSPAKCDELSAINTPITPNISVVNSETSNPKKCAPITRISAHNVNNFSEMHRQMSIPDSIKQLSKSAHEPTESYTTTINKPNDAAQSPNEPKQPRIPSEPADNRIPSERADKRIPPEPADNRIPAESADNMQTVDDNSSLSPSGSLERIDQTGFNAGVIDDSFFSDTGDDLSEQSSSSEEDCIPVNSNRMTLAMPEDIANI